MHIFHMHFKEKISYVLYEIDFPLQTILNRKKR